MFGLSEVTVISVETGSKIKSRILIIEDEPKMVDFIKLGLTYEGYQVNYAYDGKSGLKMALDNPPDLIILDLMLPGMDGFEICERLKLTLTRDIPIIMLTAIGDVDERVNGLDLGADDYMTKPFQFKELAARIRAVLRRNSPLTSNSYTATVDSPAAAPSTILTVYDIVFDPDLRELRRGNQKSELTQREAELLKLLMTHPNQVMTREVILNKVWGYDFEGDYNVIEVYIRYLRQKLGEPNLIYTIRGVGYVMRSKPKEK